MLNGSINNQVSSKFPKFYKLNLFSNELSAFRQQIRKRCPTALHLQFIITKSYCSDCFFNSLFSYFSTYMNVRSLNVCSVHTYIREVCIFFVYFHCTRCFFMSLDIHVNHPMICPSLKNSHPTQGILVFLKTLASTEEPRPTAIEAVFIQVGGLNMILIPNKFLKKNINGFMDSPFPLLSHHWEVGLHCLSVPTPGQGIHPR